MLLRSLIHNFHLHQHHLITLFAVMNADAVGDNVPTDRRGYLCRPWMVVDFSLRLNSDSSSRPSKSMLWNPKVPFEKKSAAKLGGAECPAFFGSPAKTRFWHLPDLPKKDAVPSERGRHKGCLHIARWAISVSRMPKLGQWETTVPGFYHWNAHRRFPRVVVTADRPASLFAKKPPKGRFPFKLSVRSAKHLPRNLVDDP